MRLRRGYLLFLFLGCISSLYAQSAGVAAVENQMARIAVTGPRALSDALDLVQQQLGCVITYEDPAYYYATALMQLYGGRTIIPRSHSLMFSYDPNAAGDPAGILTTLLADYSKQDSTALFTLSKSPIGEKIYNVVPVKSTNKAGKLVLQQSLLDKKISISTTGSYQSIVEHICSLLAPEGSDHKVWASEAPTPAFRNLEATIHANNEPARLVLDQLLADYQKRNQGNLTWVLSRTPNDKWTDIAFRWINPIPKSSQGINSIHVEAFRPLSEALNVIERRLGCIIIYEDPPYACSCQVIMARDHQPLGLRGGILEYSFADPAEGVKDDVAIIQRCLKVYEHGVNASSYSLQSIHKAFYAAPAQFMDKNDALVPARPLLDNPVTFSLSKQPAREVARKLVQALSATTGKNVVTGEWPELPQYNRLLTYSANNKPAVQCLVELSEKLGGRLSWRLLYDPIQKKYMLDAYDVRRME